MLKDYYSKVYSNNSVRVSPLRTVLAIATGIVLSEVLLWWLLSFMPELDAGYVHFVHLVAPLMFISPLLYFFVFKPILNHLHIIQKAESEFSAVVNGSSDGFVVLDDAGRLLYANKRFEEMAGEPLTDLIGRTPMDFEAQYSAQWAADRLHSLKRRQSDIFETRIKVQSGIMDVEINAQYLELHGGRTYVFVRDITGRKRLEEQLRNKHSQFEAILSSKSDMIMLKDRAGVVIAANSAFCNYVGQPMDMVIGKTTHDLFPAQFADQYVRDDLRVMESGEQLVQDEEGSTGGGQGRWYSVTKNPVRAADGYIWGVIVTLRDITARKRAEEELLETAANLDEVERLSLVGHWRWQLAEGTLTWSDEVFKIFGLSESDFTPTYEGFLEFVHPSDRESVRKAVSDALEHRGQYHIEHRIKLGNGSLKYVSERGKLVYDEAGKPVYMIGTVQDISDVKVAELDLKRSHALLESIRIVYSKFIADTDTSDLFEGLLRAVLELTDSKYGFIGEVKFGSHGEMNLHTHAIMDFVGNPENAAFYEKNFPVASKMHRLETIFGHVLSGGRTIIANDLQSDPRRAGVPEGHPVFGNFMGIPFYFGGRMIGMLGMAERAEGYSIEIEDFLSPLLAAIANAIEAYKKELERRNILDELTIHTQDMNQAQRIAEIGSWHWDIRTNEQRWSDELFNIFALDKEEAKAGYATFVEHVHPADRATVLSAMHGAIEEGQPYSIEHRIMRADGVERIVREEGEVTFSEDGSMPLWMIGILQDITERKQAEAELKKLSMALEESINIIFITNAEGRIEYVNSMFEKVTGFSREEAIGRNPHILSSGKTSPYQYKAMWETILSGKTWRGTIMNSTKGGQYYWSSGLISPMRDEKGRITHFLAIQEDITEKMEAEERLKYVVDHDRVTGLVNRSRFLALVDESVQANMAHGALVHVDIDGFKHINDKHGHEIGDEFLKSFVEHLHRKVADAGLAGVTKVGRTGGDEFSLLVYPSDPIRALNLAETLRLAVGAEKFTDRAIRCSVSIGVARIPEHGENASDLFGKVDAAVQRAKDYGRNRVHVYTDDDRYLEKMISSLDAKEHIITALEENRFQVWYQPILDIEANTIHHYEALARIALKDGSIIYPGSFISTAEKYGLIGAVDRAIISKTVEFLAETARQGKDYYFSVNLSGNNLGDEDLLVYLQKLIMRVGIDPRRLIFEITETAAIKDMEKAAGFTSALKELGCRFSLDDFGVGFTSFTYLRELNLDYIKIDGSFIKGISARPEDQLLVRALADLTRSLGIMSIAEFVDSAETLELLKGLGVNYAQGYYIGKPEAKLKETGEISAC